MSASQVRIFDLIELLRHSPRALNLTEIARSLKIAPSSAHAILNLLLSQSVVALNHDKRYQLGPKIFYLGASYPRNTPIYRSIWTEMVHAANDLGLSAAIAVPWEDQHLLLAVHQAGNGKSAIPIGTRVPIQAGSYGKAYYAWSGAKLPRQLRRFTAKTIIDIAAYSKAVQETRTSGYGIDDEEFVTDVGCVATAVTSEFGFEGCASFMGAVEQMREAGFEMVGERLSGLGIRASQMLGDHSREHDWESLAAPASANSRA